MKLSILIFEPDPALRNLLRTYLAGQGHTVQAFADPSICPLFKDPEDQSCCCVKTQPCGDAVLMDLRMPRISALDFLKRQRSLGCKALDANKAIMSTSLGKSVDEAIQRFGCHYIAKPFHLEAIGRWIKECAARVKAGQSHPDTRQAG